MQKPVLVDKEEGGTAMAIPCQHYPMMRGQKMAVEDMPETPRILAGGIKPKIRVAGGSI